MIAALLGLIGITLIYVEFFVPGAVLAVMGTLLILVSLGIVFVNESILVGIISLVGVLAAVSITCRLALWQIRRSKPRADFYHGEDQEGYTASVFDTTLIGKEGTAASELKPAGHITVDGKTLQALSESGFIDKGSTIHVVGGKGSHLIVKRK
ncbi:MAG: hypothetical protein HYX67_16920 [Candidatus Melainabacteria bacterium]|nr:hypothetical protein [Candidatus Melainabacteria bacterium]